jgi:hypothetical protein
MPIILAGPNCVCLSGDQKSKGQTLPAERERERERERVTGSLTIQAKVWLNQSRADILTRTNKT